MRHVPTRGDPRRHRPDQLAGAITRTTGESISDRSGLRGKTTIGAKLAALLDYAFVDLDAEIESYFETSIERLQRRYLTPCSFRKEASKALKRVLSREGSRDCVIVLPPSGLMDSCWRVVKKADVVVRDEPVNKEVVDQCALSERATSPIPPASNTSMRMVSKRLVGRK